MFDNFLPKALFLSLTIHTVVVCSSLFWQMPQTKKTPRVRGVEISYKSQVRPKAPDVREPPIKPTQQLDLKNSSLTASEGSIPIKLASKDQNLPANFMMAERKPEQVRSMQMARRISIAQIKSEKINNPAYAAYNEMVRNRIEEKVYENYRKMEAGTIYLTFIVASDGSLKASQVIEEKSRGSQNLQNTSLKSLNQSQFPPFLKGMTLPEYTFNIEIQYQVNN